MWNLNQADNDEEIRISADFYKVKSKVARRCPGGDFHFNWKACHGSSFIINLCSGSF